MLGAGTLAAQDVAIPQGAVKAALKTAETIERRVGIRRTTRDNLFLIEPAQLRQELPRA